MKKIYIIGPVGSGKTTLAKHLSKKYNIPYYELDKVVHDDLIGMKRSSLEIEKLFSNILKEEEWIIEDVGRDIFQLGIIEADMVYYLDIPGYILYKRCFLRWIMQRIGLMEYSYYPTISNLFQMLEWINAGKEKKNEKLSIILEFSKNHKVLKRSDIKIMEKKYD